MDAEYLKESVGAVLADGLARVAIQKPHDPVEFLGYYLLRHVENELREQQIKAGHDKRVEEAKQGAAREAKAQEETKARDAEVAQRAAAVRSMQERLLAAGDVVSHYSDLLALLARETGAANAYLGVRETFLPGASVEGGDEEGGEPQERVRYVAVTEGNSFLLKQVLRAEQGVTFSIWKDGADEAVAEAEEGGEGGARPAQAEPLHIPNVLRDKRVHFFRFPLLGAFLAAPLQYESALNDEAFEGEFPPEPEGAGDEEGDEDEDGEGSDGEEKRAEEQERRLPPPKTRRVQMALCMDTLGLATGDSFAPAHVALARDVAATLAQALERSEREQYERERRAHLERHDEDAELLEQATELLHGADAAADAATAELEEDAPEELRARVAASARLHAAAQVVELLQSRLDELHTYAVPPKAAGLTAARAALYLLGVPHADICDPLAPRQLSWKRLRESLGNNVSARMLAHDAEAERAAPGYASAAAVLQLLEGLDTEAVTQRSVAGVALLEWARAAATAELAAAADRARIAEEERARAEAEAAAAAEAAARAAEEAEQGGEEGEEEADE